MNEKERTGRDARLEPGDPGAAKLQLGSPVTPAFFPDPFGAFSPAAVSNWHSRGYLPHFDTAYHVQHVTFRLADSLAQEVQEAMEQELLILPENQRDRERRLRIEAWLDAGHGSCLLREAEAAQLVEAALLHFEGVRYHLFAWVIMPTHVHVLFQEKEGWPMRSIITSWKSFTGRRLMPLLRNTETGKNAKLVWQREYWDRFIRDSKHFDDVKAYIEHNPVKAGLVARPEEWLWSSAGRARLEGDADGVARLEPGGPGIAKLQLGLKQKESSK